MSLSVVLMAFAASITSGSMYLGRKELVDWQTAKARCECFGGQLATWSSSSDYDAMKSVRAQLGYNSWIGFHDLNQERDWQMIDGATDIWFVHLSMSC